MSDEKIVLTPEEARELAREARKPLTPAEMAEKADNIRKSEAGEEVMKLTSAYKEARTEWFVEQLVRLLPRDKRSWLGEGPAGWQKVKDWFGSRGYRLRQYDDMTATLEHNGKVLCRFAATLRRTADAATQE